MKAGQQLGKLVYDVPASSVAAEGNEFIRPSVVNMGRATCVTLLVHKQSIHLAHPYSVWSCGVPNNPCCQLFGCFHSVNAPSSDSTFATTFAMSDASALLSPSITNCKSAAVGTGHCAGRVERMRRVRPPLGIKGIGPSFAGARGRWTTGEEYAGMLSSERVRRGEADNEGELGGWIW